jgi:hypothetical protein
VTIQQLEKLDQGQGRFGLAILVAREGIDATAEQFRGLPLVKSINLSNRSVRMRLPNAVEIAFDVHVGLCALYPPGGKRLPMAGRAAAV